MLQTSVRIKDFDKNDEDLKFLMCYVEDGNNSDINEIGVLSTTVSELMANNKTGIGLQIESSDEEKENPAGVAFLKAVFITDSRPKEQRETTTSVVSMLTKHVKKFQKLNESMSRIMVNKNTENQTLKSRTANLFKEAEETRQLAISLKLSTSQESKQFQTLREERDQLLRQAKKSQTREKELLVKVGFLEQQNTNFQDDLEQLRVTLQTLRETHQEELVAKENEMQQQLVRLQQNVGLPASLSPQQDMTFEIFEKSEIPELDYLNLSITLQYVLLLRLLLFLLLLLLPPITVTMLLLFLMKFCSTDIFVN